MGNLDILIYAAIAAFLFFRLWSVLGQTDEDENSMADKPNPFTPKEVRSADEEDVMVLEGRAQGLHSEALTEEGHALTSLAGILDQIKKQDSSFDEKEFIVGAKNAFSEIVKAFALGKLSKVERFLGPNVSGPFKKAIKARKVAGQSLKNTVEKIVATDIVEAQIEGENEAAVLTVEFISYQINQLFNKEGKPEEEAKTEEIRDRWIFRRDLQADDPNWLLIETQS